MTNEKEPNVIIPDVDVVSVPLRKKPFVWRIAVLLLMAAGAVAIAPVFQEVIPVATAITYGIGALCVFGAALALRKLYESKPGLILSPTGMSIRVLNMPQEVSWAEITDVSTTAKDGGGLVIHLRDASRFLEHGQQGRVYEMQQARYGSPVVILQSRLSIAPAELVTRVRQHLDRHRPHGT